MNKRFYPIIALLTLVFAAMACGLPSSGGNQPAPTEDRVATLVASTLQALTPVVDDGTTLTSEPETPSLLPHSFYYLSTDNAGLTQVFRIEKDGRTQKQITFEPVNVEDYDVSPADGSVVYTVNNQLVLVNADGSGHLALVTGASVDENNPFLNKISSPVLSPDGGTIAFGHGGLNFWSVSANISNFVMANQWDDVGGLSIPKELYWPEKYSPDGSKLLITLGYYEGASAAVYYPAGNGLVRLKGGEGALICCDEMAWSADGSSFYSASPAAGMFNSGLWRVDPATGAVTTLFTSNNYSTGSFNYADEPYLAPDGQLYYFFLSALSEINTRTPLQLVRSAPDGVTGRTVLRSDTFELMNEALWAPDASFVIVAFAPTQDVYQGGRAEIVYLDGSPSVTLTNFAQNMKWGP